MQLEGKTIGFAMCGSHCTFADVMPEIEKLVEKGVKIIPFMSPAAYNTDTRFGKASEWREKLETITGQPILTEITEAEPVGPKKMVDVMLVAPCTGNTMAKLANGITDTGVLMAIKSQLRNNRPVVIGLATNDALGNNAKNLGVVLNMPNVYFVPLGQDNPEGKPNSLVADMTKIESALLAALESKQVQPLLIERVK